MRLTIVGRHSTCDVTLDDPTVSRHHAEIERLDGGLFVLSDNKSSSGTYVHQSQGWRRVSRVQVKGSDRIRLGKLETSVDELLSRRKAPTGSANEKIERNPHTGEIVVKR